jgi:two-component system response regulator
LPARGTGWRRQEPGSLASLGMTYFSLGMTGVLVDDDRFALDGRGLTMSATEVDILLVDDSQEDVDLTLHALRTENLANRVFVARDGEEALEFLFCSGSHAHRSFDHPPKLVLLDLKLPKVDGMEVLERVKSDARTKIVPVVLMTSSREERDLVRGYNLGVNSYLQKPVDFDEFRRMVKLLGLYWLVTNRPPLTNGKSSTAKQGS